MKTAFRLATLAFAASLAAPAAALAQNGPASQPGTMEQRVQEHIQQLHQELGITQSQEQQWKQFARTMWQNAHQMQAELQQRQNRLGTMNAAQDMDSYARLAELHAQDMQRLSVAFQGLWTEMTPQQRQNATNLFRQEAERFANRYQHKPG